MADSYNTSDDWESLTEDEKAALIRMIIVFFTVVGGIGMLLCFFIGLVVGSLL